jgi:DNA-binding beta-propeller fold protein YncE
MAPDATRAPLLYVSDQAKNGVFVFSYPGGKPKGVLTGFNSPTGLCADSAGHLFALNGFGADIIEYAHGGKSPIATLGDTGEYPSGCSVDPTTGNLAVANYKSTTGGAGDISIYSGAKGTPKKYKDSKIQYFYFCGYDDSGDLFLDGTNNGLFVLAELAKGKTTFTEITVSQTISVPGNVQWDGEHVAVGDQANPVVYEFTVKSGKATNAGSTTLTGSNGIVQFWIQGSNIIGPVSHDGNVMFWKYPAGGNPKKTISPLGDPIGAAVSLAK